MHRGGARKGAGRKKKGATQASAVGPVELRAALATPAPLEVEPAAAAFAELALQALYTEMVGGVSEAARVAAANEVLDRGWGKPTIESGGDLMLPLFGSRQARDLPKEIRDACRRLTNVAIEVLKRIAAGGVSESAKVSAAKSLLSRGLGAVGPALVPKDEALRGLGKKAEAERAAKNPNTELPMGQLMALRAQTAATKH